jgi:hypothetical protein
MYVFQP